jgi:hypothetical protein
VPTPTTAIVEQPTAVSASPTATAAGDEPEPTVSPEETGTVTIPSAGVFVRQCVFGAFVATVLFVFVGIVFLLRRFI